MATPIEGSRYGSAVLATLVLLEDREVIEFLARAIEHVWPERGLTEAQEDRLDFAQDAILRWEAHDAELFEELVREMGVDHAALNAPYRFEARGSDRMRLVHFLAAMSDACSALYCKRSGARREDFLEIATSAVRSATKVSPRRYEEETWQMSLLRSFLQGARPT